MKNVRFQADITNKITQLPPRDAVVDISKLITIESRLTVEA
jgi:hypothetical protein